MFLAIGVAGVEGHKLLKNPKIKSYIDERLKQLDSEKIADQQGGP